MSRFIFRMSLRFTWMVCLIWVGIYPGLAQWLGENRLKSMALGPFLFIGMTIWLYFRYRAYQHEIFELWHAHLKQSRQIYRANIHRMFSGFVLLMIGCLLSLQCKGAVAETMREGMLIGTFLVISIGRHYMDQPVIHQIRELKCRK